MKHLTQRADMIYAVARSISKTQQNMRLGIKKEGMF